jgi:hypothetical protein
MTLLLPNQWSMLDKMYTIPDTVEEYTGYQLDLDPIGWKGTWMRAERRPCATCSFRSGTTT